MSADALGTTVQLGTSALTLAQNYATVKSSKRLVLLDGLLADIDQATGTLDAAYHQLVSGQMVDYAALYNHVNNVIDLVRTGVESLHAAAGLGILPMSFVPAGSGAASSGMHLPHAPQAAVPDAVSMKARSLVPQVQAMQQEMRRIKQIVSRFRVRELAQPGGAATLLGLGGDNPVFASMPVMRLASRAGGARLSAAGSPPEQPLWLRLATLGAILGGFYHGYNRNQKSIGWGLAWTLPGGLLGPLGGGLALVKAVSDGYAQPPAPKQTP